MVDLQEAAAAAVKTGFCTLTAPMDKTLALGNDLYNKIGQPGIPGANTPLAQSLRNARNLFCNEQPEEVTDDDVGFPFTGGQCDESYRVERDGGTYDDGEGNVVDTSDGSISVAIGPGPLSFEVDRNGQRHRLAFSSGGFGATFDVSGAGPEATILSRNWTVTRQDGSADDCGNPPTLPPPYVETDFTTTPDVTYTPDSGPDITIPIPLVFAPVTVNNDLEVEVPVKAFFDVDVAVNGVLNLSTGNIVFNVSNEFEAPPSQDDPTIDPDPGPPVTDPEDTVEPIAGTVIGCLITSTINFDQYEGDQLVSANAPSGLYVPRLGTVTFLCESLLGSTTGWTEDIDVKYREQVIYCPVPWGARGVSVTPYRGVSFQVQLIVAESDRALALRAAGIE